MAHNITNYLKAHGDPADVQKFYADIGGHDADGNAVILDLSKIIPTPKTMNMTMDKGAERALIAYATSQQRNPADIMRFFGDMGDYGAVLLKKQKAAFWENGGRDVTSNDTETLELGEKLYENTRDYGAPTIGEWNALHENAVWPAYNQERGNESTIIFDTPNNDIPRIIRELSEQNPNIKLSYCFADEERGRRAGQYEFEEGRCTFSNTPKDFTNEARRIAAQVFGDEETEETIEFPAVFDEKTNRVINELFDGEADEQDRDDEDYYGDYDWDDDWDGDDEQDDDEDDYENY